MRALTLWQPWGSAIVSGEKPVENRPWAPPKTIIGQTIAIHAGKTYDRDGEAFLVKCGLAPGRDHWRLLGALIGTVRVDGVVELGQLHPDPILDHPMFFGPFGWKISEARKLVRPIPCKGALGLWTIPFDLEALMLQDEGLRA